MGDFRTEIKIEPSKHKIQYNDKVMFVGSCFADNIGNKFEQSKLPALVNPFGVIYNPMSVANTLNAIVANKNFSGNELYYHNDLWLSFEHHGSFSDSCKNRCLEKINNSCQTAHAHLKNSLFLFVTFGTAWVYQLKETHQIVANCHKYPASSFNRYILNIDEIVGAYKTLLAQLLVFNPALKIIFTVSPVRHWKDGAHGNQISKSTLLMAIDSICEMFASCQYFPAYELLMDDLRDYRFYCNDMLHPNETAIDYIGEKFEDCFFSPNTLQYKKEMLKLEKALLHKPFNPTSEAHQKFLKKLCASIERFAVKYPKTNFSNDLSLLKSKII